MMILDRFFKRNEIVQPKNTINRYNQIRSLTAASHSPTTDLNETYNVNNDIRGGLDTIRRRVQAQVNNNSDAKAILNSLVNNIIGVKGITVTSQAKNNNGSLDIKGNTLLNEMWTDFCKPQHCDITGAMSFVELQELVLKSVAISGEALVMFRRGAEFGKYSLTLEVLPIELLDYTYYARVENGNIVYAGVELNEFQRPVAYWCWKYPKSDPMLTQNIRSNTRIRIPASDILHIFKKDSPKQIRGMSWYVSSLLNLHHLDMLRNCDLQLARLATLNQVVYRVDKDDAYVVDEDLIEATGMIPRTLSPGEVTVLPPGISVENIDWKSPNSKLEDTTRTILRSVAGAMGANYNAISQDLESVNYSSARFGALESRTSYQRTMDWFKNAFVERVWAEFVTTCFVTNIVPYPFERLPKFRDSAKFTGRGFQSVDPQKEVQAHSAQLVLGLTTHADICAQNGSDYESIIDELVREEQYRVQAYQQAGLEVPPNNPLLVNLAIAEEQSEHLNNNEDDDEKMPMKKSQK